MKFLRMLFNKRGATGVRLKYGAEKVHAVTVPMAASTVLKDASGRVVTLDSSGNAALTTSAGASIFGAIEAEAQTTSSTAGATKLTCIVDPSIIFRIPITTGTYTHANYRGHTVDLTTSAGQQGVDLTADTYHHVIIVDGDETNSAWVDCKLNLALAK